MPVYINSASCISAQDTLDPDFFGLMNSEISGNIISAKEPSYKEYIPPAMIRRMSKVVKMSAVTASRALAEAGVKMPDAIITGTGMGCTEDSEKFLKNVIQNGEDFLTPTNFIQSTHNTVAGQIALGLNCHAYNFTYVNAATSLEFALLDAKLQIEFEGKKNILVGAADETARRTAELYQLAKIIKNKDDFPFDFLNSDSAGVLWGEGSSFFVLSPEKQKSTYAELAAIELVNHFAADELQTETEKFLAKNSLERMDIDAVLLGFSGDKTADEYHRNFSKIFRDAAQLYYKHLSGDFNTASGVGYFMASHILKQQTIPAVMKINSVEKNGVRNILIYNNFLGKDHSFTLLKKC